MKSSSCTVGAWELVSIYMHNIQYIQHTASISSVCQHPWLINIIGDSDILYRKHKKDSFFLTKKSYFYLRMSFFSFISIFAVQRSITCRLSLAFVVGLNIGAITEMIHRSLKQTPAEFILIKRWLYSTWWSFIHCSARFARVGLCHISTQTWLLIIELHQTRVRMRTRPITIQLPGLSAWFTCLYLVRRRWWGALGETGQCTVQYELVLNDSCVYTVIKLHCFNCILFHIQLSKRLSNIRLLDHYIHTHAYTL